MSKIYESGGILSEPKLARNGADYSYQIESYEAIINLDREKTNRHFEMIDKLHKQIIKAEKKRRFKKLARILIILLLIPTFVAVVLIAWGLGKRSAKNDIKSLQNKVLFYENRELTSSGCDSCKN